MFSNHPSWKPTTTWWTAPLEPTGQIFNVPFANRIKPIEPFPAVRAVYPASNVAFITRPVGGFYTPDWCLPLVELDLTVEHQLPGQLLVRAGYVGSKVRTWDSTATSMRPFPAGATATTKASAVRPELPGTGPGCLRRQFYLQLAAVSMKALRTWLHYERQLTFARRSTKSRT